MTDNTMAKRRHYIHCIRTKKTNNDSQNMTQEAKEQHEPHKNKIKLGVNSGVPEG